MEHVAHLDRAGEALYAEFVPRQWPVGDQLAECVAQCRGILVAGEVLARDVDRLADEFLAPLEDATRTSCIAAIRAHLEDGCPPEVSGG